MNTCEMACEIVKETRDGEDLAPEHLWLVENAVNGFLNETGTEKFKALHGEVISGKYRKPWLHGIEHLTLDQEGYVYWKENQVEHYDFPFAFTEKGKTAALELTQRCLHLEARKIEVNSSTAIWHWEKYKN